MAEKRDSNLPDFYACVALDVLRICEPKEGVWVDLGCGPGQVSCALAKDAPSSTFVLIDPNAGALGQALRRIRHEKMGDRFRFIDGRAESIPLGADSVDLVVSRGSIFFWENQGAGLREIHRVLRTGGAAMVGGGLGSTYPLWARREFVRRRRDGIRDERSMEAFRKARSPETFRMWASQAGLRDFHVIGEGGLAEADTETGVGLWLVFKKEQGLDG